MVKEGDLAAFVESLHVVHGQQFGGGRPNQCRIEQRIDIGKAAGLQQVRAAATGFTPQAEGGVDLLAGQPAGEGA